MMKIIIHSAMNDNKPEVFNYCEMRSIRNKIGWGNGKNILHVSIKKKSVSFWCIILVQLDIFSGCALYSLQTFGALHNYINSLYTYYYFRMQWSLLFQWSLWDCKVFSHVNISLTALRAGFFDISDLALITVL